ncbi:MAG: YgiT-type zinc finger protein [Chloroflexi bacterium]|nr:YgiT-type zinc finger protein [Chloroflexota bacterium]
MFTCAVCHGNENRRELVEEVFKVEDRYVLVGGVPSTVCERCGERSFSRDTTEKVRQLVHGEAKAAKTVPMQVLEFA